MEQVGMAAATHDVSLWGLFMQAGLIVKLVMIGLLAASVWTWAIVIDKYVSYARARRQFDQFE
ncbi:MAG: protein TolQ, partial [Allorhizobium sp.]